MAGRPLSLHNPISYTDPLGPNDAAPEQITVGEAIVRTARLGVPRYIAAQSCGINPATLRRWEARAAEVAELPEEQLTEAQRDLRAFCADLTRADAESATYAVAMVRKAMPADFRAAVALLERRFPRDFAKRVEIDHSPPERDQAPLDPATVSQVEEAFRAAAVPATITPESLLPAVGE